jgi:apolipoprotein N-acyltransferase
MTRDRKPSLWSWRELALSALSGALLVLSFPDYDLSALAWLAPAPLLLAIKRSGRMGALLSAFTTGMIFETGSQWWVGQLDGFNALNSFLLVVQQASYLVVFGLGANLLHRRIPEWDVLTFPSLWVLVEYVHAEFAFLALPFGILGYSQYTVLPVARLAAWTGVYGVSFLLVAASALLAELAHLWLSASVPGSVGRQPLRRFAMPTATLGALVLLLSSSLVSGSPTRAEGGSGRIKVAVVQAGVYQSSSQDPARALSILESYARISLEAAETRPDLIAWPASSVPGMLPRSRKLVQALSSLARRTETFLLVGASGYDKLQHAHTGRRYANSVFLFSPAGTIAGRYDKVRLLPFDEYLPLREHVPWPSWIAFSNFEDAEPGEERTIFAADGARFGVGICWENLFPETVRTMTARGIGFFVGMTNEGFTDSASAHHQMLAMYVFRAIENGLALVRPATTGISALIEPSGRIVARLDVAPPGGKAPEGFLVGEIPLSTGGTFYSRHGNWFPALLSGLLIALLAVRWVRGPRSSTGVLPGPSR